MLVALAAPLLRLRPAAWAAFAVAAFAAAWLARGPHALLPLLLAPPAFVAVVGSAFASTLRAGRVPLVGRIAAALDGVAWTALPDAVRAYTRRVTLAWALLLFALFREIDRERPFLRRPRRGVVLFNDHRIPYPPTALAMLGALGPRASLALGFGLVARSRQRRAFAAWERDRAADDEDVGFERFVRARVGGPAYEAFYRPYAEKVWGLDPAELSQSVAKKRVSTTAPWQLVQSVAGRALRWAIGREADAVDTFVYPAEGASAIIAWLEAQLAALGVPVERGARFDASAPRSGPVLFAGDLRDLVPTPLEHRGLYLVYLASRHPDRVRAMERVFD